MIKLTDTEFAELKDKKETFELFINHVIGEAVEQSVQQMLMRIPEVVVHHFKQQHFLSKTINEFYKKHPTLVSDENKKFFGQLVNMNALKKPELGVKEILEDTASLVESNMRTGKSLNALLEDINNGKTKL
jgi:hypothetical protein